MCDPRGAGVADKRMVSGSCLDSALMLPRLPTSCFYPPAQPAKWITNEAAARFASADVKYDPVGFVGTESKYPSEQLKYPADVRWPADFAYQFPFNPTTVSEAYPTDPFPSTSVALQNTYKMENGCYYPNAVIPPAYGTTPNDYFAATQSFSQWKGPAVTAVSTIKSTASAGSSSTSPPYRTGPGTNNVRVRTSEKYRMVYTDYQRLELEKEFRTTQFINAERKSQLSSELQLTERQIKIWFQNRRAKDRRDSKKSRVIS